jgi:hypothetical protein
MNLDRISIKMGGRDSIYMTLAKISDFSKLYTTILFDQNFSMQKINTGDSIQAFNFKNIEQFKGLRPFNAYTQDQLLYTYNKYGSEFLYQTKLHSGDLVRYNGLKYLVMGIVVNTYAQWNMPTPLLFNATNITNDFKSLYGSKLTDEQINKKINDNFQAGKYDVDMVIPLVDANDFSEYITVIQPRPTKEEVELMFDSVKAEKDLTIKSQKDVFIDTMLRLRGNEINQIKEVNEDLFKGVQTLLLSVNKAVNEQIALLPEPEVEKPARKPREKKVVEEVEKIVEIDSDELPDFIEPLTLIKNLPEPVKKLVFLRRKEEGIESGINLDGLISGSFRFKLTPEGDYFWDNITNNGDLREFKRLYGNKGEKVDDAIDFSELSAFVETEIMPKEPEVETQEVKYVELIFYPPSGGVLRLKVENPTELLTIVISILNKLNVKKLKINFSAIADGGSYTTQVELYNYDSTETILSKLIEQYDTFVKPELDWSKFGDRGTDIDRLRLNEDILLDSFPKLKPVPVVTPKPVVADKYTATAFEGKAIKHTLSDTTFSDEIELFVRENEKKGYEVYVDFFSKGKLARQVYKTEKTKPVKVEKPKPVPVEKPKPVLVAKPKPVPVEKPKPVKVEKPKPVLVAKPKPVPVEKPKPVKVEKPKPVAKPKPIKVTKPKVEDDLSFLDDLENIF